MASNLPEAATKLRAVLDYLPCEACLSQPTQDQELLCTICARTTRQVAVRVGTRTTIVIERPSPPEPVVIPPAAPAPEPAAAPRPEVVVRFADEASPERVGTVEVVVEPLAPPSAPVVVPALADAPEEPAFDIDDIVDYRPARDEFFDFRSAPAAPPREPEPAPAPVADEPAAPPPQDDFVFRPPAEERYEPSPEPFLDEAAPEEEIPVEPEEGPSRWAPPADLFPEEEPRPAPAEEAPAQVVEEEPPQELEPIPEEEPILEMETVPDEEPVLDMEVVEEEDVVEMEPVPDEAPSGSDLYRLRGFDAMHERALGQLGIREIAHLSGHDAGELASRSGVPFEMLTAWIQVADLVHEVGVPVEPAIALVASGIAGPRGLRDADPDDVADRVSAFGGATVRAADIKRWKRRA